MKFALSQRALQELSDILDHIAADNPLAAARLARMFQKTFGTLASMPGIGTLTETAGTLVFTFQRNYRIFYRSAGAILWIVRVVHVARIDPPRLQSRQ